MEREIEYSYYCIVISGDHRAWVIQATVYKGYKQD